MTLEAPKERLSLRRAPELAAWREAQQGTWLDEVHRLVRPLASGGFGHVFLTEHVPSGTLVAAKLAYPGDKLAAHLLVQEAAVLSQLSHPNIVAFRKLGRDARGGSYLLMDYARGLELESQLEQHGPLPVAQAIDVLAQLASALDYMHTRGYVHADLKPTHVILDERGRVTLIDFGSAFDWHDERQARDVSGTPGYMAPEQARGEQCGPAIDVYGLAALASEVLTGKLPHAQTTRSVMRAVLRDPPALPSARGLVRAGLDECFARALQRKPRDRFASAGEFVNALAQVFRDS